ncbi:MAG: hypothetical protein CL605_02490 [Altibacter sp.]|uniref:hypothetical protein n=1 Tax=Altibacter sp. TaxID=2024823 RepID=UPI000C8BBB2F|nr:hypothetical protein [Altibacter sp.]MAP53750.1 hypothetical protein [Altibacter sp.]|tara:strand:+ start:11147 stop:14200 length:3054 start_codon:yes stop_codon:yes gene_type:complete
MTNTVVVTADGSEPKAPTTYNIVVTKDPTVTQKLFYDRLNRTSLPELYANLSDSQKRNSLIVSPMRNDNFISFEIDFPKAQGQRYAVLKLLETNELLEYFQVSKNGLEEFIKIRAKIERSLRGNAGLVDLAKESKPTFYVAYGMGDDVASWSGPYVVELIDANITSTGDNVRQLELMFSPTIEGQVVFSNKVFSDTDYAQARSVFDSSLAGDSKPEFVSDESFFRLPNDPKEIRRTGLAGDATDKGGNGTNFAVRRMVKKFLSERFNVPIGNVLFLTDADWSFLDKFNPAKEQYQEKLKAYGINVDTPDFSASKLTQKEIDEKLSDLQKVKEKMTNQIAANNQSISKLETEKNKVIFNLLKIAKSVKNLPRVAREGDKAIAFIFKINSSGNIRTRPTGSAEVINAAARRREALNNANNFIENGKRTDTALRNQIKNIEGEIEKLNAQIEIAIGKMEAKERDASIQGLNVVKEAYVNNPDATKSTPIPNRGVIRFKMTTKETDPDKSHDSQLNVLKPLHTMIRKIKKSGDNKTENDFTLIEENDFKILKSLEDYGLITRSDCPVIIFGNERIIDNLIYPGLNKIYGKNSEFNFDKQLVYYEMARIDEIVSLRGTSNEINYKGQRSSLADSAMASPRMKIAAREAAVPGLPNIKNTGNGYTSLATNLFDAVKITDAQWKEYALEFRKNFFTAAGNFSRTSSFNETVELYQYGNEVQAELNKLTDPIVFMSNVTNANVESISFDSSPYKGVLMNAGHDSGYGLLQEIDPSSSFVNDNELFSDSLIGVIKTIEGIYKSTVKAGKTADFISKLKNGDTKKLVLSVLSESDGGDPVGGTSMRSLLDFVTLKAGTPPTFKKTVDPGQVGVNDYEVLRNMSRYIINVKLKTLPFFNTMMKLGRDCYLFGLSNNIIGATNLRDIPAPAFFTGAYTIIGYKHTISHDSAFSEFELIPNGDGIGTISGDISLVEFFNITQEDIDEELKRKKEEARRKAAAERLKRQQEADEYQRQQGGGVNATDPAGG